MLTHSLIHSFTLSRRSRGIDCCSDVALGMYTHVYMCVYLYVRISACVYMCVCIRISISGSVYACLYVCIPICTYICMCVYVFMRTHKYALTYMYVCMCVLVKWFYVILLLFFDTAVSLIGVSKYVCMCVCKYVCM